MNTAESMNVSMIQPNPNQRTARVIDASNELTIVWNGMKLVAKTAVSCLLKPEAGDKVLVDFDDEQQAYVLAILDRENKEEGTLSLPNKTLISAKDELAFESEQSIRVMAKDYSQVSESLTLKFDQGAVAGKKLHSNVELLHSVSRIISQVANQAVQKFKTYVRKTEESDQVQASHMARQVKGLYNMQSKHTILVSEKDTKIDGEHIHMG